MGSAASREPEHGRRLGSSSCHAPSFLLLLLSSTADASICTLGKIRAKCNRCAPRSGRTKENGATGCDAPAAPDLSFEPMHDRPVNAGWLMSGLTIGLRRICRFFRLGRSSRLEERAASRNRRRP